MLFKLIFIYLLGLFSISSSLYGGLYTGQGSDTDIVLNNSNGLEWPYHEPIYSVDWETAFTYCDTLKYGSYTDWRLPNYTELVALSVAAEQNPILFGGVYELWSSLEDLNGYPYVYNIKNNVSNPEWGYNNVNIKYKVYCVRNTSNVSGKGAILDINISEKYKKQPIERKPENMFANTFRMHLALGNEYGNVCDDYTFEVVGTTGSAFETACDYNGNIFAKDEVTLDFKINKNGEGYYFENGKVRITNKTTGEFEDLEIFKNFNIYGTSFNLKKDAFSFNNGEWNIAKNVNYTKYNFISYVNDIAKLISDIEPYLTNSAKIENFWSAAGYYNQNLNTTYSVPHSLLFFDTEYEHSHGLCHGMALASTANFIHKTSPTWGTGSVNDFSQEIINHWDKVVNKVNTNKLKPFDKIVYSYDSNNFQALKKILYYHVAQEYYEGKIDSWIGKERVGVESDDAKFIRQYIVNTREYLIKNQPIPFSFDYVNFGGHTVTNTQIIEYNNRRNLYFYDNSRNNNFILLSANNLGLKGTYNGLKIKNLSATFPDWDPLKIFSKTNNKNYLKNEVLSKQKVIHKLVYRYRKHMRIRIVGGSISEVRKTSDNSLIVLRPLHTKVEYNIAYREEVNIFNNVLLLPADETYKVTVKKKAGFETLKIFVTIPKDDGTADYLSYKNAEISKADATVATLVVGKNNSNKKLKRIGGADYAPDIDTSYNLELLPPSNLVGYIDEWRQVHFSSNTNAYFDPNYDSTIMIRKEGSAPTNVNDGTFLSSGYDYSDFNPQNKDYYYALYNKSISGETTDMTTIHIDTSKYSLYGTLGTGEWLGLGEVQMGDTIVKLYDKTKSNLLDVIYTGYAYGFNNLLPGDYVLVFDNKYYNVDDVHIKLTSNSKKVQISPRKVSEVLYLDVRNIVESGNTYKIVWDGESISDTEKVTLKLYTNGKWKTIIKNISYTQHEYNWTVSEKKGDAKLKIILNNGSSSIEELYILAKESNTQVSNLVDIKQFVTRFYNVILGRNPDIAGLTDWSIKLEGLSKSGADIAKGFIFSPEYDIASKTDSQYLDTLYSAFFDRVADVGGKAYWLGLMATGYTREEVLEGFLGSIEFKNLAQSYGIIANATAVELFVSRFYKQTLQRVPSDAERLDWATQLNNGSKSGSDVAFGFVFSPEFIARGLDNEAYVIVLYRAFFGREADSSGLNGWVTQLNAGTSRQVVLQGFLGAPEFAVLASAYGIRVN